MVRKKIERLTRAMIGAQVYKHCVIRRNGRGEEVKGSSPNMDLVVQGKNYSWARHEAGTDTMSLFQHDSVYNDSNGQGARLTRSGRGLIPTEHAESMFHRSPLHKRDEHPSMGRRLRGGDSWTVKWLLDLTSGAATLSGASNSRVPGDKYKRAEATVRNCRV